MYNFRLLYSLLICLFLNDLSAQDCCSRWVGGLDYNLKVPIGSLEDSGIRNFHGISIDGFYNFMACSDSKFKILSGIRLSGGTTKKRLGAEVPLDIPAGATGVETHSNAILDFLLVTRFQYNASRLFKPYAEIFAGPRGSYAVEGTQLVENQEGFSNTNESISNRNSTMYGAGLGLLVQINDHLDLNFKATYEKANRMDYLNLEEAYSDTEQINSTAKTEHLGLSVGISFRPGCNKNKNNSSTKKRRRNCNHNCNHNCDYRTQSIKRSN